MHQSKSQKEKEKPDPAAPAEEATHPSGDPMPSAKTVEEADPEKKTTYPVQWEYHTMRIQDTAMRLPSEELDGLGREGWEMVCIFHLHATINFVFKRFVLHPQITALSGVDELEELEKE